MIQLAILSILLKQRIGNDLTCKKLRHTIIKIIQFLSYIELCQKKNFTKS